jgi:hypothetical protein
MRREGDYKDNSLTVGWLAKRILEMMQESAVCNDSKAPLSLLPSFLWGRQRPLAEDLEPPSSVVVIGFSGYPFWGFSFVHCWCFLDRF